MSVLKTKTPAILGLEFHTGRKVDLEQVVLMPDTELFAGIISRSEAQGSTPKDPCNCAVSFAGRRVAKGRWKSLSIVGTRFAAVRAEDGVVEIGACGGKGPDILDHGGDPTGEAFRLYPMPKSVPTVKREKAPDSPKRRAPLRRPPGLRSQWLKARIELMKNEVRFPA